MDNFAIRTRVDEIKKRLAENAATFVLDDSAELINEWQELQKLCSHKAEDGVSYFDLENSISCPVCRLEKRKVRERMIKIYSSPTCGKCAIAKAKLNTLNIPYEEESDVDMLHARNFKTLPMIEMDGRMYMYTEFIHWLRNNPIEAQIT